MQENSSNENTKRTKEEEIVESIVGYVRFKWGISDWSARVMVKDIIQQYVKIKENKW